MTCRDHALYAALTGHSGSESPVFFRSRRNADTSGYAMTTGQTVKPDTLPPLILSPLMQRDAFQMDHDRALRGNRAKAGRIAQEAKKATTAVLRRGICSGDTKGRM